MVGWAMRQDPPNPNAARMRALLEETLAAKTLADLRAQAEAQPTGVMYEAVKADGERWFIVVCVAGRDHVARFEGSPGFVGDGTIPNWRTVTLLEVFLRMLDQEIDLTFEHERGPNKALSAVLFMAAGPDSCAKLAVAFGLMP